MLLGTYQFLCRQYTVVGLVGRGRGRGRGKERERERDGGNNRRQRKLHTEELHT